MSDRASGLNVFYRDQACGRLWLDESRRFVFAYNPEWLRQPESFPLSLSLPLRPEVYADDAAHPFFANLLPEGELRQLIAKQLHVSVENVYGLLEKI
jgi:serine/threonine-protein kinase HipA